jgi:hypothetical protein
VITTPDFFILPAVWLLNHDPLKKSAGMDDFDPSIDDDLLAALAASEASRGSGRTGISTHQPSAPRNQGQPQPPSQSRLPNRAGQPSPSPSSSSSRIQQPTPQRLDRPPPTSGPAGSTGAKVVQPTPQALAAPSSGSSILVSPRQKGNPVLAALRSRAWEYSDIPADYGLGATTCALFLRYVFFFGFLVALRGQFPRSVHVCGWRLKHARDIALNITGFTRSTSIRGSGTFRESTHSGSCSPWWTSRATRNVSASSPRRLS